MKKPALTEKKIQEMEYIDSLVFRYQAGDEQCGEELLHLFGAHPSDPMSAYVGKFYYLIHYGKINFLDRDTRRFIMTFIADPDLREKMVPFYQYADTKGKVVLLVEKIRSMCSVIPDEEFRQDLRWLFLRQVKLFKKQSKRKYFQGYLYNSFRWALKHYIDSVFKSKEPYMHLRNKMIYLQDDVHYSEDTLMQLDERAFTAAPTLQYDDELGNSWIRGITCADEFRPLTPLQRMILKLSFEDGRSDREIAEKTRLHINTINRQKLKAVRMVREERQRLLNGNDDK